MISHMWLDSFTEKKVQASPYHILRDPYHNHQRAGLSAYVSQGVSASVRVKNVEKQEHEPPVTPR